MNKQAMYHQHESIYCYAVSSNKINLRFRTARDEKIDYIDVLYETKYQIGKSQKRIRMERRFQTELFDYYLTEIELTDLRLAYIFEIKENDNIYYYCEDGLVDKYDFQKAYFNSFQFAYIHDSDVKKDVDWLKNARFYQVFIDRFNKASVKDESYINKKWLDLPNPKSFYGGDLDGIREKIPYLTTMNINALYLTPVFKSISNHKYDIIDYYEVDYMFGGNEALKRLIDECHKAGIKVVLDAVFNHVSDEFFAFEDVKKYGKDSIYYDWFVIEGDKVSKKNYQMFATCDYMPKINTDNLEVQKYFSKIAMHYIKDYHIDGWRLDVSDEVAHSFWKYLRKQVKDYSNDCVLIGENWHNSESFLEGDEFDSIMNYSITKSMMDFYAYETIDEEGLKNKLSSQLMRYTDTANSMMFNLLDCHDTDRFYSLVKCNKKRLMCAIATLVFIPGSYCLYYGTEILTEGGFDPDNRRCFDWNRLKDIKYLEVKEEITKLLSLKEKEELKTGKIEFIVKDDIFMIRRYIESKEIILKINRKLDEYTIEGE